MVETVIKTTFQREMLVKRETQGKTCFEGKFAMLLAQLVVARIEYQTW